MYLKFIFKGIPGNAYVFLRMYQDTEDLLYF